MRKKFLLILCINLIASSAHADAPVPDDVRSRLAKVGSFYAGAARLYCHAVQSGDAEKIKNEAALLLRDMVLELRRPEYKQALILMSSNLKQRDPGIVSRPLNLFLYFAETSDAASMDPAYVAQDMNELKQSTCFDFPRVIVNTAAGTLSFVIAFVQGILQFNLMMLILAVYLFFVGLIIMAVLAVLWPLCVVGVNPWDVYYALINILAPFLLIG